MSTTKTRQDKTRLYRIGIRRVPVGGPPALSGSKRAQQLVGTGTTNNWVGSWHLGPYITTKLA